MNPKQKQVVKTLLLFFLATLIASCGSGGGDNDDSETPTNVATPNPSAAYTGSRNPMLLDESNTLAVSRIIYGHSDVSEVVSRPTHSAQQQSLTNVISIVATLNQLVGISSPNNSLAARTISESEACANGGTISINGEVDDTTSTGNVVYQLTNCEEVPGEVFNGEMYAVIHSDVNPDSSTIGFNDLSLTQNGNVFSQTGTVKNITDVTDDEEYRDQTINLFSSNSATGEQVFLENFRTLTRVSHNENTLPSQVSGKIYIGHEGYVTATSSEDLVMNFESIPDSGHIFLLGASGSKARISSSPAESGLGVNGGEFRLDLDEDGDDIFELTTFQDINAESNPPLTTNLAPTAIVQAFKTDFESPGENYGSHPAVFQGDTLYLYGSESTDPENDLLAYKWTIESAPSDSAALLLESDNSANNTFIPDTHGAYQISLKVTDTNGSGSSSLAFFDFDTSNQAPEISLIGSIRNEYGTQTVGPYEAGYELQIQVDIVDIDTPYESTTENITHSYELIEKPAGSASFVTDDIYDATAFGPGKKLTGTLYMKPDLAGTYKIKLTAYDHFGLTTTETFVIEVVNNPPTVFLECEDCINGNEMVSGQSYLLDAVDSYDFEPESGYTDTSLQYVWSITSDVIDSAGQPFETINIVDYHGYSFEATYPPGEYIVTLSATDLTGLVTIVEKTFLITPLP